MNYWIIPCNIKKYDVFKAFRMFKKLNWKQSTNIEVDDIVYIYTTKPHSAITHKCKVLEVNLKKTYIDDDAFALDDTPFALYGRYMTLELIEIIENKDLEWLHNRNILGNIQGPRKIKFEI